MKKSILIISAACIMLIAGCSSYEEDHSELDNLIEQLQTTHLNTGSPEDIAETEETIPYKSLTGTVTSFSEDEITVKAEGQEKKFIVDETTQILGGDRRTAKTVTVIYCEPEKKSRSITANVITIIESAETGTEPEPQIDSETTAAASELPAEDTAESDTQFETEANTRTEPDETTTQTEETTAEEEVTTETEADTKSETELETQTETQSKQQTE